MGNYLVKVCIGNDVEIKLGASDFISNLLELAHKDYTVNKRKPDTIYLIQDSLEMEPLNHSDYMFFSGYEFEPDPNDNNGTFGLRREDKSHKTKPKIFKRVHTLKEAITKARNDWRKMKHNYTFSYYIWQYDAGKFMTNENIYLSPDELFLPPDVISYYLNLG